MLSAYVTKPKHRVTAFLGVGAILAVFALFANLLLSPPSVAKGLAAETTVTLFHDTHLHGNLEGPGGITFGHYAGLIKSLRTPNSLFLGNGDDIAPSLMSSVFGGQHMVESLNASGIDANTFGNHDFDLGPARLREIISMARYSYVSANVRDRGTGDVFGSEVGARKWVIKDVGGVKFGLTGLAPKETPILSSPGSDTVFLDYAQAMREVVPQMRAAGAEIVVLLSHLCGDETDAVVGQVSGIDVAVGDHCAAVLEQPKVINGAIVSRRGHELVLLGQLDLRVSGGRIVSWTYTQHKVAASGPNDPEVAAVLANYRSRLSADLQGQIGTTSVPLDLSRRTVRTTEAAAGNLVADAIRDWAKADVAIQNGGGIRGDRTVSPGAITKRDISEMLPFPNVVVVLRVTGDQIRAALENGVSQVERQTGRFPQVSGMSFVYDPSGPPGSRVHAVTMGGAPINQWGLYTLATNDFMAGGGDGYEMLKGAEVLVPAAYGPVLTNVLMDYVKAQGTISPNVEGRIMLLGAVDLVPAAAAPAQPAAESVQAVAAAVAAPAPAQLPVTGADFSRSWPVALSAGMLLIVVGVVLRRLRSKRARVRPFTEPEFSTLPLSLPSAPPPFTQEPPTPSPAEPPQRGGGLAWSWPLALSVGVVLFGAGIVMRKSRPSVAEASHLSDAAFLVQPSLGPQKQPRQRRKFSRGWPVALATGALLVGAGIVLFKERPPE